MADSCDMERAASYRCGNCNSDFSTICHLYKHLGSYESDGSFHFDNLLKIGFPKYDSTCTATQTEINLLESSDFEALFLFKKHWDKLSPIIHDLESTYEETVAVNAINLTEKVTAKMSRLRTRQSKTKSMTLNQMKQKPLKTANSMKDQAEQTEVNSQDLNRPLQDMTTKPVGKTKRHKRIIKCKQTAASTKGEKDLKKAESNITGKLMPDICLEHGDAPCSRQISGNSSSKVEETCVKKIEAPSGNSSCKEHDPEKSGAYNEEEKQCIIRKHSVCITEEETTPLYEQESKTQGTVKVSRTWTPAVAVVDWTQQRQTQSDPSTPLPVAAISNVKEPLPTEPTQEQLKTVVCEVCGKRIRKYGYKDHLNTHLGRRPFVCEICGRCVTSKKALGMHKLCTHIDENRKKPCKFCDKKFPTTPGLAQHMLTHTKDKEFVCVKCGRVFYNKYALNKHVSRVHEKVTKFYQCQQCDKKFKSKPHLTEHVKSHSVVFTCDICSASFNRRSSKQRHMKTHTGERDHECHICGHKFIQKTLYWIHMEKHHDLTQDQLRELFPRQHGGYKYRLPESIQELEIQTHTEDIASFNRRSSKQRHMKTHTRERDHECHICGHKFIQKTLYWVHMEKHHDLSQDQLKELFPRQHGGYKYRLPESVQELEIQTHTEDI